MIFPSICSCNSSKVLFVAIIKSSKFSPFWITITSFPINLFAVTSFTVHLKAACSKARVKSTIRLDVLVTVISSKLFLSSIFSDQ